MSESKWIRFVDIGESQSGKTMIWAVRPADESETAVILGFIKWFGRWRKYSFFPEPGIVFEQTCLRDIAEFCESQSAQHHEKARVTT